jgi:hypothetical protein
MNRERGRIRRKFDGASRLVFGPAERRSEVRSILRKVHGVERSFDLIIYFAKFLTVPAMIELFCR